MSMRPLVEVKDRPNEADLATTLIHEYTHARLHFDVEAEAVAYVVGRYFGLDTSNSAFYLAAWRDDHSDGLQERLERISTTAQDLIDVVETAFRSAE